MKKKILLISFIFLATSVKANWNIKFPTVGGKLFWTDVKIVKGWKVQKNIVTGHYRLLNPKKIRYEWGSEKTCLYQLNKHTEIDSKKKTVVLIHGLGIRKKSLKCLKPILQKEGYQTISFSYSAFLEPIESCADKLHSVLKEYDGSIYVVSHSMGGILLREYQKKYNKKIEAVAMLAPPNKGARIVDTLKNIGVSGLLGVNGKRLHTECDGLPLSLPGLKAPFITIAGTKKSFIGYFPLLWFMDEDNDGVISKETTRQENEEYHISVDAYHLNIMKDETVQKAIVNFFSK